VYIHYTINLWNRCLSLLYIASLNICVCTLCLYFSVWMVVEKAESHWLSPFPILQMGKLKEAGWSVWVFLLEVAYLSSLSFYSLCFSQLHIFYHFSPMLSQSNVFMTRNWIKNADSGRWIFTKFLSTMLDGWLLIIMPSGKRTEHL
jgi:hypothetical protein